MFCLGYSSKTLPYTSGHFRTSSFMIVSDLATRNGCNVGQAFFTGFARGPDFETLGSTLVRTRTTIKLEFRLKFELNFRLKVKFESRLKFFRSQIRSESIELTFDLKSDRQFKPAC